MLRAVGLLTAQSLRRQPIRSLTAVLAVGAGVSLAVGVFAARQSAESSVVEFADALAGPATIRVSGASSHGGVPAATVEMITRTSGVASAVPMIRTAVFARDSAGDERVVTALGVDCRVEALVGPFGCGSSGLESIRGPIVSPVLRRELGAGGALRTDLGRVPIRDGITVDRLDELNGGQVVLFSLAEAQRLFVRPESVDVVYVVPKAGSRVEVLQRELTAVVGGGMNVAVGTGSFRGADTFAPFIGGLTIVGLLGLAIGAQLVLNSISLSLEERRKETATVSAVGGRPVAVAGMVAAEAVALGLAGGALGILGASVVERRLMGDLDHIVSRISGVHLARQPSMATAAWCLVAGVAVAGFASIRPARRAIRLDLSAELGASGARQDAEVRLRPWRAVRWLGLALLAVTASWIGGRNGSLERWQAPLAYAGAFSSMVIAARTSGLGGPLVLAGVLRRFGSWLGGRFLVSATRLVREPARTSAMTLAVTSAVGLVIVLSGFRSGMSAAAESLARVDAGDRVVVTTGPVDNTVFIDSTPAPAVAAALEALPGVAAVEGRVVLEIDHPQGLDFTAYSWEPGQPGFEVYDGADVGTALRRGEVMIGPALARTLGLRAGDRFAVPGRAGSTAVTVGGVWAAPSNQGYSVVLTRSQLEALWGAQPPRALYLTPAGGVTTDELAAAVRTADLDPDLRAWTPGELAVDFADTWSDFFSPFQSLQAAMVLMAVIAVASTLLLIGAQRQREDGVLSAVGLGPADLALLALTEAAIIAALGVALGAMSSVLSQVALVNASSLVTGLPIPFRFSGGSIIVSGAVMSVSLAVAAVVPAWRISRITIVDALAYE